MTDATSTSNSMHSLQNLWNFLAATNLHVYMHSSTLGGVFHYNARTRYLLPKPMLCGHKQALLLLCISSMWININVSKKHFSVFK